MDGDIEMNELDGDAGAFAGTPVVEEGDATRMCWSGRAVVNPRLLVVEFDDGTTPKLKYGKKITLYQRCL